MRKITDRYISEYFGISVVNLWRWKTSPKVELNRRYIAMKLHLAREEIKKYNLVK